MGSLAGELRVGADRDRIRSTLPRSSLGSSSEPIRPPEMARIGCVEIQKNQHPESEITFFLWPEFSAGVTFLV